MGPSPPRAHLVRVRPPLPLPLYVKTPGLGSPTAPSRVYPSDVRCNPQKLPLRMKRSSEGSGKGGGCQSWWRTGQGWSAGGGALGATGRPAHSCRCSLRPPVCSCCARSLRRPGSRLQHCPRDPQHPKAICSHACWQRWEPCCLGWPPLVGSTPVTRRVLSQGNRTSDFLFP